MRIHDMEIVANRELEQLRERNSQLLKEAESMQN